MHKMGNADGKARAEDIPRRAQYGAGTYRHAVSEWRRLTSTDRIMIVATDEPWPHGPVFAWR